VLLNPLRILASTVSFNFMKRQRLIILLVLILRIYHVSGQINHDTLFVFVGQKISVKHLKQPPSNDSLIFIDGKYKANYRIVQNVYGNYQGKTIEFLAYDHFGTPDFSKSKYALLFVFKSKGQLFHVQYQYFDVYKTKNGRWASCGDPFYFDEKYKKDIVSVINPVKLEFDKPVTFKINFKVDSLRIKKVFPEPYFRIVNNRAIGVMGAYVEDLFLIKKEGILKGLGYF